jgi:hypothetical protein
VGEAGEAGIAGQHWDSGAWRLSGYGAFGHDMAGFGHQSAPPVPKRSVELPAHRAPQLPVESIARYP